MEPEEFKAMVKGAREAEKALGEVSYELTEKMKKTGSFPARCLLWRTQRQAKFLQMKMLGPSGPVLVFRLSV